MMYETHCHTPLCKHAIGEPEEYAQFALGRGLDGLIVTCHNPMPNGFSHRVRMDEDQFDLYVAIIARARGEFDGRLDMRMGIEADYYPGYEDYVEQQLKSANFHYVLGSLHPQLPEFRRDFWSKDPMELQRTYFGMLADAAETKLFDCISHPDLIKNMIPKHWQPDDAMEIICDMLDRIAATGVAMELNTSGVNKPVSEMNPFPAMLAEMCRRSIPVVIGSDSHEPGRVGDGFAVALNLIEDAGYETVSFFLNRKRRDIPLAEARQSLV